MNGTCSTPSCQNESRWPRVRRAIGFCDHCLTELIAKCDATPVTFGDEACARFRTRHNPCGAIVDISLPMIRRGGWVCQMCKWIQHGIENRRLGYPNLVGDWPVERQEQVLTAAGMRSLHPLGDQDGNDPLNVECLECGAAQADTLFGISEGIRLSWLPCTECNARRFKPTQETIGARFAALGLSLVGEFTGDPGRPLNATCTRCSTERSVSWSAICGGTPPCLRCDGSRLDPDAPHRVYLIEFPHLGECGVYKVGITHCANDNRLHNHEKAGGRVMKTIQVANRAAALAIERRILETYLPLAPVQLHRDLLPHGGTTECWSRHAGYPDLNLHQD